MNRTTSHIQLQIFFSRLCQRHATQIGNGGFRIHGDVDVVGNFDGPIITGAPIISRLLPLVLVLRHFQSFRIEHVLIKVIRNQMHFVRFLGNNGNPKQNRSAAPAPLLMLDIPAWNVPHDEFDCNRPTRALSQIRGQIRTVILRDARIVET